MFVYRPVELAWFDNALNGIEKLKVILPVFAFKLTGWLVGEEELQ